MIEVNLPLVRLPHYQKNTHIYIYCHLQTVLLYHNSSVRQDTQEALSWD